MRGSSRAESTPVCLHRPAHVPVPVSFRVAARGICCGCSCVPSPLLAPLRDWYQDFCGAFAAGAAKQPT